MILQPVKKGLGKILVVERPPHARDYLTKLVKTIGFQAHGLKRKADFLNHLDRQNPDLVLIGSSIRGRQASAFVEVVRNDGKALPTLFIGSDKETLVEVNTPGQTNTSSIPSNFDPTDLKAAIEQLIKQSDPPNCKELDGTIIGKAPAIMELKRHILRLAKSDLTVLITGESGTGKEVVARAIHRLSPRADKPFIKVNSAGLPISLVESELFGFEKGAFTGAFKKKPGKFQLAQSGTILLDEICEIPLPMQAKLLQVLEDNELSPLGSTTSTKMDARVLAATNANVNEMVSQRRFRLDLYYRLNVVSLHIPPLRDRKEDIDLLCEHFLKKYAACHGKEDRPFTDQTRQQFHQYSWAGNVRELENVIRSITAIGNEEIFYEKMKNHGYAGVSQNGSRDITTSDVLAGGAPKHLRRYTLKELRNKIVSRAERDAIAEVLYYTDWNRKKTAALLKTSYRTLLSKMKEYQIE